MQGMMMGQGDSAAVKWELIDSGEINHVYSGGSPTWISHEIDVEKTNRCIMFKHYVHLTKAVIGNSYSENPMLYLDGSVHLGTGNQKASVDLGELSEEAYGTRRTSSHFEVTVDDSSRDSLRTSLTVNHATIVEFVGKYEIWGLMV